MRGSRKSRNSRFIMVFGMLMLFIVLSACKKENLVYTFTQVETGNITVLPGEGAEFHGSIIHINKDGIADHGFVWDIHEHPCVGFSWRISLGPQDSPGDFSAATNSGIANDFTYYARAYIIENEEAKYGNAAPFQGQGSLGPEVFSILPSEGSSGDTIVMNGARFRTGLLFGSGADVFLNEILCRSSTMNDSLLEFIVPSEITPGMYLVSASTLGNRSSDEIPFEVISP